MMPSSILHSLINWSGCRPTLPGCPAPRSRILKTLWGRGGLIVAVASFLGVPGNNITPWGHLTQPAVQGGNWATEQRGSPTQGALVTEGTDMPCAGPSLRAEALEFFSGFLGQFFGPPGSSNPVISSFANNTKGNVGTLRESYKTKGISIGGNFGAGQAESGGQRLAGFL